jgi:hypothetical protein
VPPLQAVKVEGSLLVVNNSVQLLHSKPDRDLRAGQEGKQGQ